MSTAAEVVTGEAAASELERLCGALIACLAPAATDARYRAPESDGWSAIEVLAHAAELVPYWTGQADAVAARTDGGDQPFGRTHDDLARIAAVREHAGDRYETLAERLREGAGRAAAILRAIPIEHWSRTGVHARRGPMSVGQIVGQFLLDHLAEHTEQARAAIRRG